mmetsp:Transcript_13562/g.27535  ORF Transcript_13562/g.27535 Transcript_13562/m.27535 type:complete len:87 (+) Transcript_13562:77-337(+)
MVVFILVAVAVAVAVAASSAATVPSKPSVGIVIRLNAKPRAIGRRSDLVNEGHNHSFRLRLTQVCSDAAGVRSRQAVRTTEPETVG